MPRRPRVVIEGGVYHVYNRAASEEPVFTDPEDASRFVNLIRNLIRNLKTRDGWTVFAWCLMSSDYHNAVRTSYVLQAANRAIRRPGAVTLPQDLI